MSSGYRRSPVRDIVPAGERSLIQKPNARKSILGLESRTSRIGQESSVGAWQRAASLARCMSISEIRSVASFGRKRPVGASLRKNLRSKGRPYKSVMKDIAHLARSFFKEEEYAQFIGETKMLLARKQNPQPGTTPFSFMLLLHVTFGFSREEIDTVVGDIHLTVKVIKRITRQRLRKNGVSSALIDRIMDLVRAIHRQEQSGSTIPLKAPIGRWTNPALIARSHFKNKSLSCCSFNPTVGCSHGCEFCYVPSVSTNKLKPQLAKYGVSNPDAQWGEYALLRPWDERQFLGALKKADGTPIEELNPDGNRAVLFSSTTDPYQVFPHPDPEVRKLLMEESAAMVRQALQLILEHSTLNVRILTRSPLAKRDFDLYRKFGDRLLFGMSLPTLDDRLAKIYEPGAPSPSQRLKTLQAANEAGLHVYVAVAPTYPECGVADFERTLAALKPMELLTIFHEPINIRAENVRRIERHAAELGVELKADVFATRSAWRLYANTALRGMETAATKQGLAGRLHLWPDSTLGSKRALSETDRSPEDQLDWLQRWWNRISEWPSQG